MNIAKLEGAYVKYLLAICAVIFVTIVIATLGYHVVGQLVCFAFTIFPDKNFITYYKLIVYGILPRAMVLIAVAAIFTMLCERTAGKC